MLMEAAGKSHGFVGLGFVVEDKDGGLLACMRAQTKVCASALVGEGYQLFFEALLIFLFPS
jgi:hypothetical protein